MVKNEIQEQRMREYFIEATKKILKGEGLKAISARNIAEQAGYSYATLYNYFKDIKELIFECVQDFQEECSIQVTQATEQLPHGPQRIREIIKSHTQYFIQYPGIFELFYLEKISDIGNKQGTAELIRTFLERLCATEWDYCVQQGLIKEDAIEPVNEELRLVITGLLLFYLNRFYPENYPQFMELSEQHVSQILERFFVG
ncbi:TetR/AcrR family transcriptional regulator [bacterium]|nr:TetR/AcrR family transcriptional regulator [bacterium]